MKKLKSILIIFALLLPVSVLASEVRLELSKVDVKEGDELTVSVMVHADDEINAVEGTLVFDKDKLEVKKIIDGSSSINFWIEKPQVNNEGIRFSGITPGGFEGTNNLLFSVVFRVKEEGLAQLSLKDTKALINDGLGTEEALVLFGAEANIVRGDSTANREVIKDTTPPESFIISLAQDPNIFNGKWFAVFSTQDKDTGVSLYEIREYKFRALSFLSRWKKAESPYELRDQSLKSFIEVRATDSLGNHRVSKIDPQNAILWYEYALSSTIILISLLVLAYILKKWR